MIPTWLRHVANWGDRHGTKLKIVGFSCAGISLLLLLGRTRGWL